MIRHLSPSLSAVFLLLGSFAGAADAVAAQAQPDRRTIPYTNQYEIRFLGPHAAETLAWDQCPEDKSDCRVRVFTEMHEKTSVSKLEVHATVDVQEKVSRALARQDIGPKTQTFYVVLLAANPKPAAVPADLSPGARKALQDIQGFLPYKGYQVLDTALLRGTRELIGRLVGREGVSYGLEMSFQQPGGPDSKSVYVQGLHFREQEPVPLPPAEREEGRPNVRGPRVLIRTSFTVQEGETLVVGTSRLDGGDEALVLLLTASPAPAS